MRVAMFLSLVLGFAPLTLLADEPTPPPYFSGVAVIHFDRLLKFQFSPGRFTECVADSRTVFSNIRDYQECQVQDGVFTLQRQNLHTLTVSMDSVFYSETVVGDILFKVYNFSGNWIDVIEGTTVSSRIAVTVVDENGVFSATLRNAKFDLKADLVLDRNANGQ